MGRYWLMYTSHYCTPESLSSGISKCCEDGKDLHLASKKGLIFRFKINAFTPDTIPMSRLAEYMADLADVLGEKGSVRFNRIEPGSCTLVSLIDRDSVPRVVERAQAAGAGRGPAAPAFERINERLREDNGTAKLLNGSRRKIVTFPGVELNQTEFSAFNQEDSLDGEVIRVGGKDATKHALLHSEGRDWRCDLNRDLAVGLAKHLFSTVRVFGQARWLRNYHGQWDLKRFKVTSFEVLNAAPLEEVVAGLHELDSGWGDVDNPDKELRDLRSGVEGEDSKDAE